jgi:hypothetical protein
MDRWILKMMCVCASWEVEMDCGHAKVLKKYSSSVD